MALARGRRERSIDYWPGFVDALSTLVLGIIFLLTVFVVVQFFLSQEVAGKDSALTRLNVQIAQLTDLGQRLNVALAQRVQELSRYRSDFFGRLREILGNRPDIRVVGDRFVFPSEVFFDSGQAVLSPEGRLELDKLAGALLDLDKK